jgi:hypothetical protein
MMHSSKLRTTRTFASLAAAVFAVLIWVIPAQAADVIFPIGSRIGLVPPPGMALSKRFMGYEDAGNDAAILLATFPAEAFSALDKSMVPDALKNEGIDKREPLAVGGAAGFLLSGMQAAGGQSIRKWMLVAPAGDVTALVTVRAPDQNSKYTDQMIRAALLTLAVRKVPDAERLSLVPFKIGDLAGFQIDDVLPGRALMLVDEPTGGGQSDKAPKAGANDTPARRINARFLIALLPGGPTEPKDDDNFARIAFNQIGGIKDVRIQDAEPLRINGQSGYETLAKAKDPHDDTDLMVVQWLRFGTGGFMQMVGIAHADLWPGMLTRLREVRDSIDMQ